VEERLGCKAVLLLEGFTQPDRHTNALFQSHAYLEDLGHFFVITYTAIESTYCIAMFNVF